MGKKVCLKKTGWSERSDKMFKKLSQCLVKQFNKYKVLTKLHVSATNESLARM